jgi:exopolyphosphatase/guanosine-5'-triphosphate,3'-diphosphate pyrophosphatase
MTERPLAAIDIGTNSFHMVVARVGEVSVVGEFVGPAFEVIAREKEMVRLGSSSGDMKELSDEAIDRGVLALKRLAKIAAIHDADVVAVATSAVREAENAAVFIDRARDEDIGGGSTEILVGEQGEMIAAGSLKLGAIRLTRRFFRGERLHPGAVESCRRHIRSVLAPMVREVERVGFGVAIASSGTAETVASLVNSQRGTASLRTMNNFVMTSEEIKTAVRSLVAASSVEERRALPGMDPSRADIILAGALILEQAVAEIGIDEIVISDNALREGVLLDALSRRGGASLLHLRDLRRRSVLHLAESMDNDVDHSMRAAGFALDLFDATALLHGLGDDSRELLEAGALLANVGLSVSHSEHHKHSYYVIRHSDRLSGFTDHEIELIAQIARYHRKSAPKPKHPEFARLWPEDQARVQILAGLLRVAIALDRSHKGRVERIVVSAKPDADEVVIAVQQRDGFDADLEVQTAEDRKGLLEEVLQRRVRIE